jgi:hypothetical protein
MRAFQSDRRRAAALMAHALLAVGVVLASASALGQQAGQSLGPPISLVPPFAASPAIPPPVSSHEGAIAGEPLALPSLGWSADMAPPQEALPDTFWRGTTRETADLLLARVPATLSPALQSLARRLLLSPAAAPEGPDEGEGALPALRAAALLRLGELDAARAVIAAIPERERRPALPLAVAADAIDGDIEPACAAVREAVRGDQGAFWQKSLIACQGLQGEAEQASLGLRLLAEEQGPPDEALTIAIDALAGRPSSAPIGRADALDPLTLRLLVAARQSLAPALVAALPSDPALCLALDEKAPDATRLAAAERAARFGALPPDRLRTLYLALAGSGETASGPEFDLARRFAAIGLAETNAERLDRIVGFADAFGASQPGGLALAGRLVLPDLREIEPEPRLAASASVAARLLIAAGDAKAASRWAAPVSGTEDHALRFLVALATGREALSVDQPEAMRNPMRLALATALGQPVSSAAWARLPQSSWVGTGPPSPPLAAWLELAEAVRAKRIGETVLATIMVAAPTGTLSSDPIALFAAVSGLRQIGLEADARRLAVEAALAADFR